MRSHYHPKCFPRPKKVITTTSTDEDIVAWLKTAESGYEERSEIEKAALVADIRWGMENDPKERAKMQGSAKKRKWEEIMNKVKQERGPDVMEVDSEEEDTSLKKKKKKAKKKSKKKSKKRSKEDMNFVPTSVELEKHPELKAMTIWAKHNSMNSAKLKSLCRWNRQIMSGTKDVLVERCTDGALHGAIPPCPTCSDEHKKSSTTLKVVATKQSSNSVTKSETKTIDLTSSSSSSGGGGGGGEEFSYKCAGWFDSDARCRRSCSFKAGPGELARDPWVTIEADSKRKLVGVLLFSSFIVGNLFFFIICLICFKNTYRS